MITLISGVPGAGKTLFAVSRLIRELEKNPERDVFADIKGLKFEGVKEPPDDWRDTPEGSLIIYDECQFRDIFKRERGRSRYQCIVDLTTHRHTGRDIWLITQSPIFLHTDVLAVVGEHFHLNRPYGAKLSVIYKWRNAESKPQSVNVQKRAENKAYFKYNKDLFNYYDSVDVSDDLANHKGFSIPFLHYLPIVFGLLVLGWAVNSFFGSDNKLNVDEKKSVEDKRQEVLKLANASASAPAVTVVPNPVSVSVPAVASTPAVVGSVVKPVSPVVVGSVPVATPVPVVDSKPANVIVAGGRCSAYTLKGDKLPLSNEQCLRYKSNVQPLDFNRDMPNSTLVIGDRLVDDDEPVDKVDSKVESKSIGLDKPLKISELSVEQEQELALQLAQIDKPLPITQLDDDKNLALQLEVDSQLLLNDDVETFDSIAVVGTVDSGSAGVGEL